MSEKPEIIVERLRKIANAKRGNPHDWDHVVFTVWFAEVQDLAGHAADLIERAHPETPHEGDDAEPTAAELEESLYGYGSWFREMRVCAGRSLRETAEFFNVSAVEMGEIERNVAARLRGSRPTEREPGEITEEAAEAVRNVALRYMGVGPATPVTTGARDFLALKDLSREVAKAVLALPGPLAPTQETPSGPEEGDVVLKADRMGGVPTIGNSRIPMSVVATIVDSHGVEYAARVYRLPPDRVQRAVDLYRAHCGGPDREGTDG